MSFGSELVALLVANNLGVWKTDLFLNSMPDTPDACCALDLTSGAPPKGGFGVIGILHESPSVRVRVRGPKYDSETPRIRIERVYRLFPTVMGTSLSGTKYLSLQPLQPPFILEEDGFHRVTWTFNALAEKELSAL